MGLTDALKSAATDPIDRYVTLVRLVSQGSSPSPALTPDAIQGVITATGQPATSEAAATAVAEHVAKNSNLTAAQAKPRIAAALQTPGTDQDKTAAASDAVTGAGGISGDIELSDPVMLKPPARIVFAALLFVALLLTIVVILILGDDQPAPSAALISLGIIAVLTTVGILVLVMGYKNVTIKGGPPAGTTS
jgi:hypothetical protein